MRLLLDTPTLLWALGEPTRLPSALRAALEDRENNIYVSSASGWEITIKAGLGKLDFPVHELTAILAETQFLELPITLRHTVALRDLPAHHRDPLTGYSPHSAWWNVWSLPRATRFSSPTQ